LTAGGARAHLGERLDRIDAPSSSMASDVDDRHRIQSSPPGRQSNRWSSRRAQETGRRMPVASIAGPNDTTNDLHAVTEAQPLVFTRRALAALPVCRSEIGVKTIPWSARYLRRQAVASSVPSVARAWRMPARDGPRTMTQSLAKSRAPTARNPVIAVPSPRSRAARDRPAHQPRITGAQSGRRRPRCAPGVAGMRATRRLLR